MGTKLVRVCDVTGDALTSPVNIGFTLADGRTVKFEVNQKVASQFVLALASRLSPEALLEVVEEFFNQDWEEQACEATKTD